MKVFVPVSDEMLNNVPSIEGTLVPFNLEYLQSQRKDKKEGVVPHNWISDSNYAAACRRLAESQS